MGTHQSAIPPHTNRRLQKFPCDGVKRYKVAGKILSYSETYQKICAEEGCYEYKGMMYYRQRGIKRLLHLNEIYTAVAKDCILAEFERSRLPVVNAAV